MIISLLLGALLFSQGSNVFNLAFPTYNALCKGAGTPTLEIKDIIRWDTEGNTTKFYSIDDWINPGMAISGMSCMIRKDDAPAPEAIPKQAAPPQVIPFPFTLPPGYGVPQLPQGHPKARSQKVIEEPLMVTV